MNNKVAVFLDRDGTINVEEEYLSDPARMRLLPGAAKAVKLLNENGILAIVTSNQSGIGRGKFTQETLDKIHDKMNSLLKKEGTGAFLDDITYCTHVPEANCACRKPNPELLYKSRKKFGIDLKKSYVVGDKLIDIEFAANAGAKGILVLTGYGEAEKQNIGRIKPVFLAKDLYDAAIWILKDLKK